MLYRIFLLSGLLFCFSLLHAQLQDDFSDGELTTNPSWSGDLNLFQVSADLRLQSNGPAASDTLYLSTSSTALDDTEWRFSLNYAFAPSTSNQLRVYLVADQADLEGPINGYYLGIGESGSDDSFDLFRQDGSNSTKIIDGITGNAGSAVSGIIRVLRDSQGNWQLFRDATASNNFVLEGSVQDLTYQSTASFGLWVKHTSSRAQSFFFDDFYVGPEILDTQPPEPISLTIESIDELRLTFSEGVEPTSAQNPLNYSLDQSFGNPLSVFVDPGDPSQVVLSFGNAFAPNTTYVLSISNIADNSGNVMPQTIDLSVTNVVVASPAPGDVIFNEILPDPTPSIGLPATEYVELYNRSSKVLNLQNWTLSNGSTNATLPDKIVQPSEYMLFCRASDTALFSVPVIGLSTWPALVNSGDELTLFDPVSTVIDAIAYTTDWYQDGDKDDGGYSLERINP
ncbi:MAG: lamin tail domain-containing protein, partial [Bacteroidota bacterium]